jgi:hypothetical protein
LTILNELPKSEYLIYLASEKGANSPWVIKELITWYNLKRQETLIIVQTNGELKETKSLRGQIDWENTTVLPLVLKDLLISMRYYVNLKWIREEDTDLEELNLSNPRFEKEIRGIIAQLRGGISPDEVRNDAIKIAKRDRNILRGGITLLVFVTFVVSSN